jgi:hypothetical protein
VYVCIDILGLSLTFLESASSSFRF